MYLRFDSKSLEGSIRQHYPEKEGMLYNPTTGSASSTHQQP